MAPVMAVVVVQAAMGALVGLAVFKYGALMCCTLLCLMWCLNVLCVGGLVWRQWALRWFSWFIGAGICGGIQPIVCRS